MEKFTLKAYANKHKLSIFNVMKMVKEGSVPHQTALENGKEVIYIIEDESKEGEIFDKISRPAKQQSRLEKEIEILKKEVDLLRREVERLKTMI